ncbi:MAG TPA: FAD-dependent oxidoreductase [Anaeromyxobacter sp.]|nr:FAD-dependent oxidoreductase [Anaeromyxobacter sp.]
MSGAPVVVAGAGPAGLAAGLALARAGRAVKVLEASDGVGGLARTMERDGYRFDVGGHRFFTRVPEVRALWRDLLGDDLLVRQRRSRILFRGRFFDYPLTAGSALAGLGAAEGLRIALSYARARLRPVRPEASLADWFTNQFGRRLFETFFRPYTEKVWGRRCEDLAAEWAAQRIQGMSLRAALADMLRRGSGGQRTLVTEFEYPRLGPGLLWERMRAEIERRGGEVLLRHRLTRVHHEGGAVRAVEAVSPAGSLRLEASHLVSTLPLRDLVASLSPAAPTEVAAAAAALAYRDFLQVALVLDGPEPFPDTWLYLHDPGLRAGRIQNFRAWSPELIPDPAHACLGVEYFCSREDPLWRLPDSALVEVAREDLAALRLPPLGPVLAGHVVRMRDAYPVYDDGFRARLATIRAGLAPLRNLLVAGRNGTHRYNNMDHSILTGLVAGRRVLGAPLPPRRSRIGKGPSGPAPHRGDGERLESHGG